MSYFSCFLFLFLCPAFPWWVNLWVSCFSSCFSWVSCLSSLGCPVYLLFIFLFIYGCPAYLFIYGCPAYLPAYLCPAYLSCFSPFLGGKIYGCPVFLFFSCFSFFLFPFPISLSCFSLVGKFMGVLLISCLSIYGCPAYLLWVSCLSLPAYLFTLFFSGE